MNALKPGLLDIVVLAIVAIVLFLPNPTMLAQSGLSLKNEEVLKLSKDSQAEMALLQARHYTQNTSGSPTSEFVDTLIDYGHLDQAIRVASESIDVEDPTQWKRHLNYSGALTERFEVEPAILQANLAKKHCQLKSSTCRLDQKSKIELFLQDLEAAQKALDKGLDPKKNSQAFKEEMNKHKTQIRIPNINL